MNNYNQIHIKLSNQTERKRNTIKQPQKEQMVSRVGNHFIKDGSYVIQKLLNIY